MRTMKKLTTAPLALLLALALAAGVAACRRDTVPPGAEDTGPAPMPQAQGIRFVDAELGRAVGGDRSITDATNDFAPNDTIYVSIETDGSAASSTVVAHWTYQDGQTVEHSEATIAPTGPEHTEFHISKPDGWPAGEYHVEISLDGRVVDTLDFEVAG